MGWGEIYVLGCVASWVAYSLIGKVIMKDFSPLAAVTYSCLIGGVALLVPACMEGLPGLIGSLYLGIGSVLSISDFSERSSDFSGIMKGSGGSALPGHRFSSISFR